MSYIAVLTTMHMGEIPEGLEEPHGVFSSREAAAEYLAANCQEWMARAGGWPYTGCIRLNEYATRHEAETADVTDGFRRGDTISGHKPLHTEMR